MREGVCGHHWNTRNKQLLTPPSYLTHGHILTPLFSEVPFVGLSEVPSGGFSEIPSWGLSEIPSGGLSGSTSLVLGGRRSGWILAL